MWAEFSVDLNLTLRIFAEYSGFLPHQKLTRAVLASCIVSRLLGFLGMNWNERVEVRGNEARDIEPQSPDKAVKEKDISSLKLNTNRKSALQGKIQRHTSTT